MGVTYNDEVIFDHSKVYRGMLQGNPALKLDAPSCALPQPRFCAYDASTIYIYLFESFCFCVARINKEEGYVYCFYLNINGYHLFVRRLTKLRDKCEIAAVGIFEN